MKLADYVFDYLARAGIRHAFVVTGGGAMHLNDALGQQAQIEAIYPHHEQVAAMAAEAYARIKNNGLPGLVSVTTGPGGLNALNGVFGAYTDSIPMLVISGQVKRETCMGTYPPLGLRQLGDQEVDILRAVSGITKYAALVSDPQAIRAELAKALYLATTGRPGPCWIDIPVDMQSAEIDPDSLPGWRPPQLEPSAENESLRDACGEVLDALQLAQRPVVLGGSGVHLAGARSTFRQLLVHLGIPATTAWTAPDLIETRSPYFCGRPGTVGDRPGNIAVQNSDLLLVLGSRLNIRQTGYAWADFAPHAFIVHVDIDPAELHKPGMRPGLAICADLAAFCTELTLQLAQRPALAPLHAQWLQWCRMQRERFPVFLPERHRSVDGALNPYHFINEVVTKLRDDDVVVCSNATASVVPFQLAAVQEHQRWIANSGSASMGYGLPAAIGAAFAAPGRRVICFEGDGSLQMNIQELQTVAHHRLPIVLFVLNNRGYLSMRQTQEAFFGRLSGADSSSGISFPDYCAVAAAYGLATVRIDSAAFGEALDTLLAHQGPLVCEVMLDPAQGFEPRSKSRQLEDGTIISSALDDLFPFLDPEELHAIRQPPSR